MTAPPAPSERPRRLYTSSEVGVILKVDPKTVTRWDLGGKLPPGTVIRTPGGHRRYDAEYIDGIVNGGDAA